MRITRKKSPLVGEYNIEGQPLESVNVYKDLGLFTASNLSWNQHIDKITAKANRVLGIVKAWFTHRTFHVPNLTE